MAWTRLDIFEDEGFADALSVSNEVFERATDDRPLLHDLEWIAFDRERRAINVFANGDEPTHRGLAIAIRQERPIPFHVGEFVVYRKPLARYEFLAGPTIIGDNLSEEACKGSIREFLMFLGKILQPGEALSFEGLPTASALYNLMMRDPIVRQDFVVILLGKPFAHQFIQLPESFDDYVRQLSRRSRKSVQYSRRKLFREFDGDVQVECYEAVEQIDEFLDNAIDVSKKSYQWRLLKRGLRDRESLSRRFAFAAERGWLRSYLLFCKSQPVAFMVGYQCRGCYFYVDVGYDPDWAGWSVGSILQYLMLEDLYRRDDTPRMFDFSTGYGEHKARFANYSQEEVNVLLLPKTIGNRLLFGTYHITEAFSNATTVGLEKIGIKKRLKRFFRRLAR